MSNEDLILQNLKLLSVQTEQLWKAINDIHLRLDRQSRHIDRLTDWIESLDKDNRGGEAAINTKNIQQQMKKEDFDLG